jgi:hypothetical protein
MRLATSSWSVAASLMLSCAQPAQHEHCARSTDVCAASTVCTSPRKSGIAPSASLLISIFLNRALATVSGVFSRPYLPRALRSCQSVTILKCKSNSHYSLVCFVSIAFPDGGPDPRKNRPQEPPYP